VTSWSSQVVLQIEQFPQTVFSSAPAARPCAAAVCPARDNVGRRSPSTPEHPADPAKPCGRNSARPDAVRWRGPAAGPITEHRAITPQGISSRPQASSCPREDRSRACRSVEATATRLRSRGRSGRADGAVSISTKRGEWECKQQRPAHHPRPMRHRRPQPIRLIESPKISKTTRWRGPARGANGFDELSSRSRSPAGGLFFFDIAADTSEKLYQLIAGMFRHYIHIRRRDRTPSQVRVDSEREEKIFRRKLRKFGLVDPSLRNVGFSYQNPKRGPKSDL